MKKIISVIAVIIIVFLVVMAILLSGRNFIAKKVTKYVAQKKLGVGVEIGKLDINLAKTTIDINNLIINNPKGFSKSKMIFIPRIYVDYVLSDLLRNKINIKKLDFYLKEILVERNKTGLNLEKLKFPRSKKTKKREKALSVKKKPTKAKKGKFKIDKLHLKVDKVKYIQKTKTGTIKQVANINIDTTFNNITNLKELKAIIASRIAPQSLLNEMKRLNLQDIKKSLQKGKKDLQKKIENIEESTKDIINDLSF